MQDRWDLIRIIPVDNMTYHFVAKAEITSNQSVILRMGLDEAVLKSEKNILTFFNGVGAIKLLDFCEKNQAMLLEQAIPGDSLRTIYPSELDVGIDAYYATMQKLHSKPLPSCHLFPHIRDWLAAIDNVEKDKLPKILLGKAIFLKNDLRNTGSVI